MNEGVAHFSGLQSCGSVWSCPACAAKIRQARAVELEAAIGSWLAKGGGVEFVTFTIPHGDRDRLEDTFELVASGWTSQLEGEAWFGGWRVDRNDVMPAGARVEWRPDLRKDAGPGDLRPHWWKPGYRERWGVAAWVRTVEVTLGVHGWHPHIHALLFTDRPWTARQRAMRGAVLFARWSAFVQRETGRACSLDAFRIVGGALGAGSYITKVQESDSWRLGMEFTRGDLKTNRARSMTPFELIAPAADGVAFALRRWWEWERVTRGRKCMSWSLGGRSAVGLDEDEPTDEELAEAEVGGDEVLSIDGDMWARIVRTPGADAQLLATCEAEGAGAGSRFLSLLLRPAPPP